jgi:hypothetical protein
MKRILLTIPLVSVGWAMMSQATVARIWNEALLQAIREDFARPTVHARNLFHCSIVMYDAWVVYGGRGDTYLLGKNLHGFDCPFTGTMPAEDLEAARAEAISHAAYRLLSHRFRNSPNQHITLSRFDVLMDSLEYDRHNTSTDYRAGPAELGNYLADRMISYGLQDGSNEEDGYQNRHYQPVNPPLIVENSGNAALTDINRWQPLSLRQLIDQSGNPIAGNVQQFLSPEWGAVRPFALRPEDRVLYRRDSFDYPVYFDPGPPPQLDTLQGGGTSDHFRWGHLLVSAWGSHLDPSDGIWWDISPGAVGNRTEEPTQWSEYPSFYDLAEGGDDSPGHPINPYTGQPYAPQIVPRGDYTRVLAEFWADGPHSETPPGHWFSILNQVSDHPALSKRIGGEGPVCADLEWDVKAYFALGGALHDVAVCIWGIKGWYDSSRPITALRGMAEAGQSQDPTRPGYHPGGLPLVPGLSALIEPGDSLAGPDDRHVGEVKLYTWRGTKAIGDPSTDRAGVGWIRAGDWLSYQRPTFVSPPFAGYLSGHSAYSRAAAEVLTALTGDPYFPGGIGEFPCRKNEFLVFEEGPGTDIILQWATYRDAADQCSLSRIWGGIHPPFDDIPARRIGKVIGNKAYQYAETFFTRQRIVPVFEDHDLFPNPSAGTVQVSLWQEGPVDLRLYATDGRLVLDRELVVRAGSVFLDISGLVAGTYFLQVVGGANPGGWTGRLVIVPK